MLIFSKLLFENRCFLTFKRLQDINFFQINIYFKKIAQKKTVHKERLSKIV
jgi:hypothetical protein